MHTEQTFFELLRVALGNADTLSHLPSAEEWTCMYDMARKQCLVGIGFAGIQRLGANAGAGYASIGMSKTQWLTWMGVTAQIQQQNEIINRQCAELQKKLASDGIHSCILKGQGVGSLYTGIGTKSIKNLALLRQPGDIDVWIDAPREDVIAYVRRCHSNLNVDISSKHVEFPVFDNTVVEAHFIPAGTRTPFIGRRAKAFYDGQKKLQMQHKITLISGEEISAPYKMFQAIHILHHAFGHFLFEGIGLRQVMDYYFVMRQPFNTKEQTCIANTLKQLELWKFARGIAYIHKEVFGGQDTFIPADEHMGKRILKSVMAEGNFGKHDEKRNPTRISSNWYRFWYHTIRAWKYIDMAPWTVAMGPLVRTQEYVWRLSHGYFKKI